MRNNKSGISGRYSCGAIRPHTIPMGSSLSRKSSRMTTSHAWWGMQQFLSYGVWNFLFVFMSNTTDCYFSFHDFNSAARASGLGLAVIHPVKKLVQPAMVFGERIKCFDRKFARWFPAPLPIVDRPDCHPGLVAPLADAVRWQGWEELLHQRRE